MLTDILEINQASLSEVYDFAIRTDGVCLVFGAAGIGKTEMAIEAIKKHNLSQYYVNLSVLEAPDLIGLPKMKGDYTSYAPPEFLPWLKQDGYYQERSVLILDEIDKAKQELQNPLLELLQFRSINNRPLHVQGIICTGNLPDERAFSRKLSHALTDRCAIYKLKCEFKPWRRWAANNNVNPLIVSFLQNNQEYLLKKNESGDPTAYCSPTPRSWVAAAKALDQLEADYENFASDFRKKFEEESKLIEEESESEEEAEAEDPQIEIDGPNLPVASEDDELENVIRAAFVSKQYRAIAGRVGVSAAFQLKTWFTYYRELEPKIQQIFDTGTLDEEMTSDRQIICATSLITKMKKAFPGMKQPDKLQLAERIFGWMLDTMSPAFLLAAIKSTLSNEYVQMNGILESKKFNEIVDKVHEIAH